MDFIILDAGCLFVFLHKLFTGVSKTSHKLAFAPAKYGIWSHTAQVWDTPVLGEKNINFTKSQNREKLVFMVFFS
jgi:hypothetical protein